MRFYLEPKFKLKSETNPRYIASDFSIWVEQYLQKRILVMLEEASKKDQKVVD